MRTQHQVMFPRVHLAVNNCFASKRWAAPSEWMAIACDLGVHCIEASADTECDPLYMGSDYLSDWMDEVKREQKRREVRVTSLYSGHGTYATLGLAHFDDRVRDRIQKLWLEPMIRMASDLDARLGFYCHAFSQRMMETSESFKEAYEQLSERLVSLGDYADHCGLKSISVEQMYTPHQIPWRIQETKELLSDLQRRSKGAFYVTIDTGHQTGQRKFLHTRANGTSSRQDYLFAEEIDGDPYAWLARIGCYSPIIHLQQTDGTASAHLPFRELTNNEGKIKGKEVLEALRCAYEQDDEPDMPPRCEDIFLTLEIFPRPTDRPEEVLRDIGESVEYWRQFVPRDGTRLNELVASKGKQR